MIRKIFLRKLFAVMLFAAMAPQVSSASVDASERDASVIRIINVLNSSSGRAASGTGFIVNDKGYAITNHHVIDGIDKITGKKQLFMMVVVDGKALPKKKISVVWSSKEKDIAIVKVEDLKRPAITLYTGDLTKGSDVIAVGFPGVADDWTKQDADFVVPSETNGVISRIIKQTWKHGGDPFDIIQHNAQINHGNSGGPLLNAACNQVIGVNTQGASAKERGSVTGVFFASHISNVIEALKANNISFDSSSSCNPEGNALLTQGLMMGAIALLMGLFFGRRKVVHIYEEISKKVTPEDVIPGNTPRKKGWSLSIDVNGWPKKTPLDNKKMSDAKGLVIGRDANISHCPLKDSSISGRHCRLISYQGELYIEDLNSTNGTMVNGKEIIPFQSVPIANGDELLIGDLQATLVKSGS